MKTRKSILLALVFAVALPAAVFAADCCKGDACCNGQKCCKLTKKVK